MRPRNQAWEGGRLWASALLLSLCLAAPARAGQVVDLELVLAVDCSGSVEPREFDLQLHGIADAFRHPDVLTAIRDAGARGLAVALVQWASSGEQRLAVDWTLVSDAAGAQRLARRIAATPRYFVGGDTAVGAAIGYALQAFHGNGYDGLRQVIDISGDGGGGHGQETANFLAKRARDEAVSRRVTINGLAILNENRELDLFYRDYVIGGAGAFVLAADDYRDFATAFLKKLITEIGNRPLALPRPSGETPRPIQLSGRRPGH